MKELFLATYNEAKIERFRKLIKEAGFDVKTRSPKDFGLENIDPEETGKNLKENAEIKARAYFGKVNLPILANDTGFWVEGEGLVEAPKRTAIGGSNEKELSKEEIAAKLLDFWKGVAGKHGGRVDAAWIEAFAFLSTDGKIVESESKREIILTDREHGKGHVQMPMRALYISKTTNKPSIEHTKDEEILELKPITDALSKILADWYKKSETEN